VEVHKYVRVVLGSCIEPRWLGCGAARCRLHCTRSHWPFPAWRSRHRGWRLALPDILGLQRGAHDDTIGQAFGHRGGRRPEGGEGTMTESESFSDLEAFARDSIAAHRYPNDHHPFRLFACDVCGAVGFHVTIEHHTGSTSRDFKGVIWGDCTECGTRKRLFSFTGQHRKHLREERPVCQCGNASYIVGECERIEGDEGLSGFFDEGVVVGQCSCCGRNRALVYTD